MIEINATGDIALRTQGKYCQEDILIRVPSGTELPELTNEGTASDMLSGKQLINSEGEVVTGNIPIKTVSDLASNGATVTVPSGYYASQATKSVSTATQATPSISVDSAGKITASATQTAGYVSAGTKSATKQLAFQPAKTITPSSTSQVAVSSGYYTGGDITVKGDSNLIASNIKSGVNIFGVAGTYEGSGGSSSGGSLQAYPLLITDTTAFGELSGTANFTCLNEDGTIEVVTVEKDAVGWYAENVIVGSTVILKLSSQSEIPAGVEFSDCTGDINISEKQMCFTILSANADSEWGMSIELSL